MPGWPRLPGPYRGGERDVDGTGQSEQQGQDLCRVHGTQRTRPAAGPGRIYPRLDGNAASATRSAVRSFQVSSGRLDTF